MLNKQTTLIHVVLIHETRYYTIWHYVIWMIMIDGKHYSLWYRNACVYDLLMLSQVVRWRSYSSTLPNLVERGTFTACENVKISIRWSRTISKVHPRYLAEALHRETNHHTIKTFIKSFQYSGKNYFPDINELDQVDPRTLVFRKRYRMPHIVDYKWFGVNESCINFL